MSFKFNPYSLSITYNIENDFLDKDLIITESYIEKFLKNFFKYLRTNEIDSSLIDYLQKLEPIKKNKLIHQVSSVIHEKKHFHDYMLSSSGNHIIRRYFYLYANTLSVMAEIKKHEYTFIKTPISRMPIFDKTLPEGLKFFIEKKVQAFNSLNAINSTPNFDEYNIPDDHIAHNISGLGIFESGAVLTQFSLIEDLFGSEYAMMDFQLDYYDNNFSHYTRTVNAVQLILNELKPDKTNYDWIIDDNTRINTLLFISLNGLTENEKYIKGIETPALRLMTILKLLIDEQCNIENYSYTEFYNYIEDLLEKNNIISCKNSLLENVSMNKKHYKLVQKIMDQNYKSNDGFSKPLLDDYKKFINFNEVMVKEFLLNPISYLSPLEYIYKFQKKFPTQDILEFDSGTYIHQFLINDILKVDDLYPLIMSNDKIWSFKFNIENTNDLNGFNQLYTFYSAIFFTLVEGKSAKYDLVHPKIFDYIKTKLEEMLNVKIEDAFPILDKITYKQRMQNFWKHINTNIKCDLCYSNIEKYNGYMLSGDEIYKESIFSKIIDCHQNIYEENYSMFCVCENCFSK